MKMGVLAILLPSACILIGAAIACVTKAGASSILNPGPHGLSEILYAFASAAGNNGSAFAGLNGNTVFYNLSLAFNMFVGRYGVLIPVLAIAGSMVKKKTYPTRPRHLSDHRRILCRGAGRRGDHRGRPDLLSGPGTGAAGRAPADVVRKSLLGGKEKWQSFMTWQSNSIRALAAGCCGRRFSPPSPN